MMRPAALIVAAGQGRRAGEPLPKQFMPLAGVPVVARAIDALADMPVTVAIGEGQEALLRTAIGEREVTVVTGGAERRDSVRAGLDAIVRTGATHVLIHDAARPLLPRDVIARLLGALESAEGAVPVLPVADTLARAAGVLGEVVDRAALVRVQTPQAFRLDAVLRAQAEWAGGEATDDAQVVRAAGYRVATVEGAPELEKLTSPGDRMRMERALGTRIGRTGYGYDVHRLEAGEELWLCGVRVPHDRGLAGHSDADVGLHALTDALLATIAAGDIGTHFPPSDPQWRGAASHRFVEHAVGLVEGAGGRIEHVDVTLVCEAPKIGPHRSAMQAALAGMLRLPPTRVSVKATTTERLGFAGRGEGIAAHAVATVSFWEVS